MRGIMDAVNDPAVQRIVVAKAVQVAYTETLNCVLGYYMDQDPASILVIMPTLELAQAWSKDRLAPMLRDTPALQDKVSDPKSRDSGNTIRQKIFPGGRLTIIGANSPAALSARPIRFVFADEVDRWPVSAGTEGDPLSLAAKRQVTFWNRKTLLGSTPTLKLTSVIWREFEASDQRKYYVPCPHCQHPQVLKWSNVRWDRKEGLDLPDTAYYQCEECGAAWDDNERHDAVGLGFWRATNPGARSAGFHVPGFLSPWMSLSEIVREFLTAKNDPYLLQVWTNTVEGMPWEEMAERLEGSGLIARGESYTPRSLPRGVRLLTAGIDIQKDRIEVVIVGWGAGDESWVVAHEIFHGDPVGVRELWEEVDALLLTKCATVDGREMRVAACCIDVGFAPGAQEALNYCRTRHRRRLFATKGASGPRPIWPKRSSETRVGDTIHILGVDTAKDAIYQRLRIRETGPGYIHFPAGQGFDETFYAQLTSEEVQVRKREGRTYRVWVLPSGRRNEVLDCMVLALAARMSIPLNLENIKMPVAPEIEGEVEGPEVLPPSELPETEDKKPLYSTVIHSKIAEQKSGGWMQGGRSDRWWNRK